MLTARLHDPSTTDPYFTHPIWREALTRLRELRPEDPDATIEWRGRDLYVMVQGYDTQPRAACRYEAHRRYLDIQLMLAGEEIIEVAPTDSLVPDTDYDTDKDLQFFHPPKRPGLPVHLRPGEFAVFLPHDAHMPKIQVDASISLRKAVVKINLDLFAS